MVVFSIGFSTDLAFSIPAMGSGASGGSAWCQAVLLRWQPESAHPASRTSARQQSSERASMSSACRFLYWPGKPWRAFFYGVCTGRIGSDGIRAGAGADTGAQIWDNQTIAAAVPCNAGCVARSGRRCRRVGHDEPGSAPAIRCLPLHAGSRIVPLRGGCHVAGRHTDTPDSWR